MEQFLNELPQEFAAAKTVEFIATPGFCYHQIDAGKSAAGTLKVYCDFGTGYKLKSTIDFANNTSALVVTGRIMKIKLVPTSVSAGGFSVSYASGKI